MDKNVRELLCFEEENREIKEYYKVFLKYLQRGKDGLTIEESRIFDDKFPEIDGKHLTLRSLCKGLGIEVPEEYNNMADELQKVKLRTDYIKPGDIFLILRSAEEFEMKRTKTKDMYDLAIENGAKLIIMDENDFKKFEAEAEKFPVITVDNLDLRILRLFHILRQQHNRKVVMITGSVGKTTTKQLCDVVTRNHFSTFVNTGNTNSVHKVAQHLIYKSNLKKELYIQEAGAGYVGSVTLAGAMLQPDIFVLTNVYKHHMENYGTLWNVFSDKTGADEFMTKDGIIITNYDDKNIRNYSFKHKVVSFAIDYEEADYRAVDIKQSMEGLSFFVLEKKSGEKTEITVKIQGEHNVYNILAAYVLAKVLGVTEKEIKDDLKNYKPEGIRQNFTNIGGVYFNVDCYNVAEESILAMLKSGEKTELKDNAKRYAIIGGENKLGDEASKRSREFGKKLAGIKVDKYLFCGVKTRSSNAFNKFGDALSIKEGLNEVSKVPSRYSRKIINIMRFLEEHVKPNDLVMLKGIYHLNMTIAVDKVFGTSFSFGQSHYKKMTSEVTEGDYKANLIQKFAELEIVEAPVKDGELIIPKSMKEYPVFRIGEKAFKGKEKIIKVQLGDSVENIGANAFEGCKSIKELTIPGNVKVVEKEAFRECSRLQYIMLEKGVTHIDDAVFAECEKLEEIQIPATVGMIADNAFEGCGEFTILCEENSFAHMYAQKHDISYKIVIIKGNKNSRRKRTHWWNRF